MVIRGVRGKYLLPLYDRGRAEKEPGRGEIEPGMGRTRFSETPVSYLYFWSVYLRIQLFMGNS